MGSKHRQLLEYTYEDHLPAVSMRNYKRKFEIQDQYGWTSLAYRAEDMKKKPEHVRSLPVLFEKIEKEDFRYMRINLSYTSKSHEKKKLRWMVGFFFDFDEEQLKALGIEDAKQLRLHVESFGYTVVATIKSSTGFHVWLPMQPLRGCWNGEKTIRRYDRVLKKIAKQIGSDPHAASAEHYFRCPNAENLCYFNPVSKPDFSWYEEKFPSDHLTGNSESENSPVFEGKYLDQFGILAILHGKFGSGYASGRNVGRNNAAYTLGKAFFLDGWDFDKALNEMKHWYNRIDQQDFDFAEVEKCVRNAYSDGHGLSDHYVFALTGIHIRFKKKKREERRDHLYEIEKDIINHVKNHYIQNKTHLQMSQSQLAAALGVALDSLKKTIAKMKEKGILEIQTEGKGRYAVSIYKLAPALLTAEKTEAASNVVPLEKRANFNGAYSLTPILANGKRAVNSFIDSPGYPQTNDFEKSKVVGLFGMQKSSKAGSSRIQKPVGTIKKADETKAFSVGTIKNGMAEPAAAALDPDQMWEDLMEGLKIFYDVND